MAPPATTGHPVLLITIPSSSLSRVPVFLRCLFSLYQPPSPAGRVDALSLEKSLAINLRVFRNNSSRQNNFQCINSFRNQRLAPSGQMVLTFPDGSICGVVRPVSGASPQVQPPGVPRHPAA